MKKNIYILLLAILSICKVTADPISDITKANKAYQAGFFENAVSLYEKVIKEGYASPELYYNTGNAYYKLDNFPMAILYYERALKLDPSNEDIVYNLKVANNQIIDKIDQLPQLFYERWWESLKVLNSPDKWATFTIILFSLFFLIVATFLLSTKVSFRRILLPLSVLLLFFTGISFILALESYHEAIDRKDAIVFSASLPVKSSPEESGIDLFIVHEGLKVEIIDELAGWKEIRIANGSKGWVKSETIIPV